MKNADSAIYHLIHEMSTW